jgi:hypothetical protein
MSRAEGPSDLTISYETGAKSCAVFDHRATYGKLSYLTGDPQVALWDRLPR